MLVFQLGRTEAFKISNQFRERLQLIKWQLYNIQGFFLNIWKKIILLMLSNVWEHQIVKVIKQKRNDFQGFILRIEIYEFHFYGWIFDRHIVFFIIICAFNIVCCRFINNLLPLYIKIFRKKRQAKTQIRADHICHPNNCRKRNNIGLWWILKSIIFIARETLIFNCTGFLYTYIFYICMHSFSISFLIISIINFVKNILYFHIIIYIFHIYFVLFYIFSYFFVLFFHIFIIILYYLYFYYRFIFHIIYYLFILLF